MLLIRKAETPQAVRRAVAGMKGKPEWRQTAEGDAKAIRENWFEQLPKDVIREALLSEQHYLCGYCMKRITNDGSHTTIDHFIPLSKDKEKALDYQNMIAVCKGGEDTKLSEDGERGKKRVLCCDRSKGDEDELLLNPYNQQMMNEICYHRDGRIYFKGSAAWSKEAKEQIQKDINETLFLNGKVNKEDGSLIDDTATQLVKGRKDAFRQAEAKIKQMAKKNRLTSVQVQKEMERIYSEEVREEFAGVVLFVLKRKQRSLAMQESR